MCNVQQYENKQTFGEDRHHCTATSKSGSLLKQNIYVAFSIILYNM